MSAPIRLQSVDGVAIEDGRNRPLFFFRTTIPADATPGYPFGSVGIQSDGTDGITAAYINIGSETSASFKPFLAFTQGAALTAQLTTITHTAPGTPDYAIQQVINTNAYGFVTADEANTVLSVIANLQARLAEVEARLESLGLVAAN